jgi:hypothetical protein
MKQEFLVSSVDLNGDGSTTVSFIPKGKHRKWKIDNRQFTYSGFVDVPYKLIYPKYHDVRPGDTIWIDLSVEKAER